MSHLDEPQLFSSRYGRMDGTVSLSQRWSARHRQLTEADPLLRCICPGTCPPAESNVDPCGLRATQEDFLCDECRQWCVAIDSASNYHQFATLVPLDWKPTKENPE